MFLASAITYLAKVIYSMQRPQQTNKPNPKAITVVCISDTHNFQPMVPHGDLLIHAGDLTQSGTVKEVQDAFNWIRSLSHSNKVVIAGNHDLALGSGNQNEFHLDGIHYLQASSTQIQFFNGRSMKIFRSPCTLTPGT